MRLPGIALLLRASLAAAFLAACAAAPATKEAPKAGKADPGNPANQEKALARLVSKGDLDRAQRLADSLHRSPEPAEREAALYWKAIVWLYRDQPDSAQAILEANQGRWTGGIRKVHASLFLSLARESGQARTVSRARHEEAPRPAASDRSLQERVEVLQKESADLRAENARLETEKEKYQKLLKDLETIR